MALQNIKQNTKNEGDEFKKEQKINDRHFKFYY